MSVNWIAVLVAVAWAMLLGGVVYARPVLGGWWMKQVGLDPDSVKRNEAMRGLAIALALSAIMAIAFAFLFDWTGASGAVEGATVGLVAGLAFGLPVGMVHPVFEGRPLGVGLLYGAHHVVELVVVGAIYGAMG